MADFRQARELVEPAIDEYGTLDVLVNNAGILRDRMVFSMTEEEWDSVIRVHLKGHFNTIRFAAAHWRERSKAAGRPGVRPDHEHLLGGVPRRLGGPAQLRGGEGRDRRADHLHGPGARQVRRDGQRDLPARPHPDDGGRLRGLREPEDGRLDALAPEHVAPLVGYLASPAAARVNGQLFVVHGGMVAVLERPTVAAKFDTKQDAFGFEELDAVLTPYYAERPRGETLRGGGGAGPRRG